MRGNFAVALLVVISLAAGACAPVPKVAGNTFDSYGPGATRVTVSYDLSYVSKTDYTVPGAYGATAWLYADTRLPQPEQFLELHLIHDASEPFEAGPGETVELGQRPFQAQIFCLVSQSGEAPKDVQPYLMIVDRAGFGLSRDVLLRRFIPSDRKPDRDRVDLVYIEDLARHGFTCKALGDLGKPSSKPAEIFLMNFKLRSERSFDVVR